MKDIYELFNDVNIDVEDYEEMEVTELEKKQVKNNLKKALKKKKRNWKKNILAAAAALVISTTALGVTFPAYAQNIPIIGNIFQAIDANRFANFQEFSDEVGITQTSNDISITVNDAVFDGETVFITYSIESDRDLGEYVNIQNAPSVEDPRIGGGGGGDQTRRVSEHHFIGLVTITSKFEEEKGEEEEEVLVSWEIDSIRTEREGEIRGEWNFAFSLDALDREEKLVNETVEKDGSEVTVNKLYITPVSLMVFFEQKPSADIVEQSNRWDVELSVKDDLGNVYEVVTGIGSGALERHHMEWITVFEKVDPNATKLIITPEVFTTGSRYQHSFEEIVIELR